MKEYTHPFANQRIHKLTSFTVITDQKLYLNASEKNVKKAIKMTGKEDAS